VKIVEMKIVDRGTGVPVVLVPGIQGRWEWMSPTVDTLAARCRVITFSLADEPTCGASFDDASGFNCYVQQIADAMDQVGLAQATICGISYGGLIAATFAARHPERVSSLVLTSALPPSWQPDARARFLISAPRLLTPLFCLGSLRIYPEIAAARGGRVAGVLFSLKHVVNVLRHWFSPTLMARRITMLSGLTLEEEIRRIDRPTLVITGDAALERVVPVHFTREYVRLLPQATSATITQTGHLGLITKPEAFADLVLDFAGHTVCETDDRRRRVG
jgi:pimeloyl-ACP methyl ester carboxylesterase